ncbi:integrin alpha-PS2 [Asbolus verrucosus]|uniref:Integrin alpha-PS2 n=1 Tax=Asbolus verrucosus TaxID=1661398 RepID=A0A482VTU5_ASBVE|nr:integrin alpha-PS2 [Asbolus verrucosus]
MSPALSYNQWGYHRQGSCQAGFSAAINSVGNRLFIGAPGSWYWQGQMYSIDAHAEFEFKPLLFSATYGAEGQVHQQSLETRAPVFATTEGTEKDDDSYMGYSTIVGDFLDNKDPKDESIAVGMPRGNSLKGVVIIFTWNLTDVRHLPGDQLGSYFGYALASSDVDGDGKVDLIVGSPMYTVPNNKDKFDMGRVYVIYHSNNTVRGTFMVNDTIDGFNSRSRFGQALAALGDINQDGYQDFAVGAPYDGTGNRGAVYIYHGSSKGVRQKYSQVIFAEDIVPYPAGALTTFGFSITGGLDLDDNEYPDMAVGAYLSNKAFFFRSRPVIRVDAWVVFVADNKEIDIAKSNHVVRNRTSSGNNQAVKTEIQFCARYYGKGIPGSINLDLQYILDSKKLLNPRMFFVETEGVNVRNDSIRLFVNRTGCSNETKKIEVYVMTDIHDKLTPLVAEVKYWMKSDADLHPLTYQQNRNPRSILVPVLDLNSPPSKKDTIKIYKDCGDDKICIPDLSLEVKPNVEQYMLDSKDNLELDITVLNTKEDAYDSTFEVHYPEGLNYINYVIIKVETSFSCTENGNRTIRCEIGNPVPNNKIVHFKIVWKSVGQLLVNPTSYDFVLKVNSTNPEDPHTLADNIRKISVGILYDYHPEISGKSIPPEIFYSSNVYTVDISNQTRYTSTADRLPEEVIGPWVVHVYYLTNEGKSAIEETELFFVWPGHMLSEGSEDFLYLVEPPRFSSSENLKIRCGPIPVNQRDFEVVLHNKTIWERYHIDIGQERAGSSKQVMTTASPVSTGEESSTAASETKVKAVVGGGTATTNEAINTAVAQGGDISEVNRKRNLTSEEMKIQISQKQFGQGGNSIEIGHARYYYRCLQTLNGRERQIDCGPYFSSFSTLEAVRLMEQGGDFQRECLMEINGVTKIVDCTTLFTNLHDSTRVALQIGHHQAGFGGGNRQTIGNKQYYYRCVQTINGEQKIVPCELYFSSQYISNLLQQSGDLAQHKCMTQGADGKLVAVDCGVLIANQRGAIKVQVSHQPSGARANTIKIGNTQYYYRCLQTINGNEREIDCGPYFSSLSTSTSTSDIIKMLQQGGIFQPVNGEQKEVPCEPYFSSEYITRLLQQGGNLIQHKCMMRTPSGKLETVDCATQQEIKAAVATKVQISQGQDVFGGNRIGNTQYYYRCVQTINGRQQEVACGPQFSLEYVTQLLQQGASAQHECVRRTASGRMETVDCANIHENENEHQMNLLNVRYRCFLIINREYHDRNCESSELLQKVEPDGPMGLCLRSVDGGAEQSVSCAEVVKIHQYGSSQNFGYGYNQSLYDGSQQNYGFETNTYGDDLRRRQQGHRNPQTYGTYGGSRNHLNTQFSGAEGAALGGSFQTGVLNLDTLGANHHGGGYETNTYEEDGFTVRQQSRQDEFDETIGRDNVPTDKPSSNKRWYGRKKRQTIDHHPSIAEIQQQYPCSSVQCTYMRCTVQNLSHEDRLVIALRGRINVRVFEKMGFSDSMSFSSMMISRVRKLPHQQNLKDQEPVFHEVVTTVKRTKEEFKSEMVPLWVVVLSAVAGTIILLLLVFLLYKFGFFKRNRPSSAPERQPLNRNGYHHGDECLIH